MSTVKENMNQLKSIAALVNEKLMTVYLLYNGWTSLMI